MADKSAIEWTDATWNPVTGCAEVTPGCDNCYAKTFAERWRGIPGHHFEQGFDVVLRPERLDQPLRWTKPRMVFVNSMSDLFHDSVPDDFIAEVFAVMALAPQHTFQLLTKRHGRLRSLLSTKRFAILVGNRISKRNMYAQPPSLPLPNVWVGVSVEDQKRADLRIPALLDTPAAVRWLSMEPLLGAVTPMLDGIDWVVVGGESGRSARPMDPNWARALRDRCENLGVPFFFKQWGEWAPNGWRGIGNINGRERLVGPVLDDMGHREVIERVGKKAAGRELDGRTWDEYPAAS